MGLPRFILPLPRPAVVQDAPRKVSNTKNINNLAKCFFIDNL